MNLRDLILGSKLYIAVEASGTADRTNKPAYDNAAWVELGGVTEANVDSTETGGEEVWKPVDGVMQLYNVHDTKRKLKITASLTDISVQYLRGIFGATIVVNTAFIPLTSRVNRRVWVKFEAMDDLNASVILAELFCNFKVTSAMKIGEGVIRPDVELTMLYSALNVINIPTASGL